MRLTNPALNPSERERMAEFAQWVLDVGDGKIPAHRKEGETEDTWINIPRNIAVLPENDKIPAIISAVYTDFENSYSLVPYLAERCIVCPVNSAVDEVNELMV